MLPMLYSNISLPVGGLAHWYRIGLEQQSFSTSGAVCTWMGDCLRVGTPSLYVTSYPGQLSLAIPSCVQ